MSLEAEAVMTIGRSFMSMMRVVVVVAAAVVVVVVVRCLMLLQWLLSYLCGLICQLQRPLRKGPGIFFEAFSVLMNGIRTENTILTQSWVPGMLMSAAAARFLVSI